MSTARFRRFAFLVLITVSVSLGIAAAQEAPKPAQPTASHSPNQPQQEPVNPDTAVGNELSKASEGAVHAEEGEAHEEHAELKYSSMVQKLGRMIGIGPIGMYWVSLAANFIFLALFFWMLLRSRLPQVFRNRTASIQKALTEAHAASAEASRRLGDIEARLTKLDTEVSQIRAEAERQAVTEEEHIRAAAEEDKRKVVDSAEVEIAAIARSARQDLKSFAASLAVDIATHKIKVDNDTDQALVRQFVAHLGKDGE